MKKVLLVLLTSICFLLPALADSVKTNKKAETGTPENSVIFYGFYDGNKEMRYFQANQKMSTNLQQFKGELIVSDPVEPGSIYRLQYVDGKCKRKEKIDWQTQTVIYEWTDVYPLNLTTFDVIVPKKPGLFFIGVFDGKKSSNEMKPSALELKPNDEIKCLKAVLKKYKGTSWEPVIQKKIEELQNEIKK